MKRVKISEEELEMMNYNDIAYVILEQNGKKIKIIDLFNEVSRILGLEEEEYQSHIGDFFELLSTDKRFIMLDEGYFDLRVKHDKGMIIDSDEDDEEVIIEEEEDNEENEYDDEDNSEDDVDDDDLSDLVIIDDVDEENM